MPLTPPCVRRQVCDASLDEEQHIMCQGAKANLEGDKKVLGAKLARARFDLGKYVRPHLPRRAHMIVECKCGCCTQAHRPARLLWTEM